MKTSNKLLLGAFTIIVIAMIIANFTVKKEMDKIIDKQKVIIEQTDTIQNDSTSAGIHININ